MQHSTPTHALPEYQAAANAETAPHSMIPSVPSVTTPDRSTIIPPSAAKSTDVPARIAMAITDVRRSFCIRELADPTLRILDRFMRHLNFQSILAEHICCQNNQHNSPL